MANVQIYRDAPVIANKVRPNGSISNGNAPLRLKYTVDNYIDTVVGDPNSELLKLTLSSRRGARLQNSWVRTLWQTAF